MSLHLAVPDLFYIPVYSRSLDSPELTLQDYFDFQNRLASEAALTHRNSPELVFDSP